MKKGYYEDANVMCPYYQGDRDLYIKCNGLISVVSTSFFPSKKSKEEYKDSFCNCNYYKGCKLYQALLVDDEE